MSDARNSPGADDGRANTPDRGQGALGTGSLGAGNEAAVAMHAQQASAAGGQADGGNPQADARTGREGDRAGSEPVGRNREHTPSYGGMAGAPRTSSDQREIADPEGDDGARVAAGANPGAAPEPPIARNPNMEGGSADRIPGDAGSQAINPT